jgi:hypothetical protein
MARDIRKTANSAAGPAAEPLTRACLVYRLLRYGREDVKQSMADYEKKLREQQGRSLRRKAAALGHELVSKAAAAPGPVPG